MQNRKYGNNKRRDGTSAKKNPVKLIHAPFNFVPLWNRAIFPNWSNSVSHDVPFSDGISGIIECHLKTTSEIYVRNGGKWNREDIVSEQRTDAQSFFKVGNEFIIPGTSLKGMIRNVLEIASFGKMNKVDNRRYSVRDLNNKSVYRKNMSRKVEDKSIPEKDRPYEALPHSGWLTQDKKTGKWYLTPCDYARVEQMDLIAYHNDSPDIKRKQSSGDKYKVWGKENLKVNFDFKLGDIRHSCGMLRYKKASNLGNGRINGTIVFTGQPGPNTTTIKDPLLPRGFRIPKVLYGRRLEYNQKSRRLVFKGVMSDKEKVILLGISKDPGYQDTIEALYNKSRSSRGRKAKHMEFIFFEDKGNREIVRQNLKEDFDFIHSTDGNPNEEWRFWKSKLNKGEPVPVFFLGDAENPTSMGLTLMYRLAYNKSIHEAISNSSPDHLSDKPDLAETMFGFVKQDDPGLKGRISVCPASTVADSNKESKRVTAVLGSPKASYYPIYIEQDDDGTGKTSEYKTFMDDDCRIRGWKRYPARRKIDKSANADSKSNVMTRFIPLKKGTSFKFRICIHNLKPVELGALVWVLTWGGRNNLCHSLGMGKPLGYGLVKIEIQSAELYRNNSNDMPEDKTLLDECSNAFVSWIEDKDQVPGWLETPQMTQLLNMADPEFEPHRSFQGEKLRYMKLDPRGINEFVLAKEKDLCLLPHASNKRDGRNSTSSESA